MEIIGIFGKIYSIRPIVNANQIMNFSIAGQIFKFYLSLCDTKFYIAVNNVEFCTYDYRIPVELIRTVQLKYDLQFVTQVDQRSIYPTPHPAVQFDDARNIFSNDVPRPFKYGKVLYSSDKSF